MYILLVCLFLNHYDITLINILIILYLKKKCLQANFSSPLIRQNQCFPNSLNYVPFPQHSFNTQMWKYFDSSHIGIASN